MKALIFLEQDQIAFDPALVTIVQARDSGTYIEMSNRSWMNLKTPFDDVLQALLGWAQHQH